MKRGLRLLAYGAAALVAAGLGIFFFVLPGMGRAGDEPRHRAAALYGLAGSDGTARER